MVIILSIRNCVAPIPNPTYNPTPEPTPIPTSPTMQPSNSLFTTCYTGNNLCVYPSPSEGNITGNSFVNSTLIINSTLIPGISQYTLNLKIRVIGTHTFPGDLTFSLTGPQTSMMALVIKKGGGTPDFNITVFTNILSFFLMQFFEVIKKSKVAHFRGAF